MNTTRPANRTGGNTSVQGDVINGELPVAIP